MVYEGHLPFRNMSLEVDFSCVRLAGRRPRRRVSYRQVRPLLHRVGARGRHFVINGSENYGYFSTGQVLHGPPLARCQSGNHSVPWWRASDLTSSPGTSPSSRRLDDNDCAVRRQPRRTLEAGREGARYGPDSCSCEHGSVRDRMVGCAIGGSARRPTETAPDTPGRRRHLVPTSVRSRSRRDCPRNCVGKNERDVHAYNQTEEPPPASD